MAFLQLESFASETDGWARWSFDPETHARFRTPCASEAEAAARTVGWADEIEVGVFARRKVFVTLHLEGDRVAAFVADRLFLWPGPLRASRRSVAPFVKRFEVTEAGRTLVKLDYLHDDPPGFPGSLATDLLRVIAETTASEFAVRRFRERRRLTLGG